MGLRLKPGLHRVWRGPATVQIGLHEGYGVVLDGVDELDVRLLDALDGSLDERAWLVRARVHDRAERAADLLALLRTEHLLAPGGPAVRPPLPHRDRDRLAPDAAAWSIALRTQTSAGDGDQVVAARRGAVVRVDGPAGRGAHRMVLAVVAGVAAAGVGAVSARSEAMVRDGDVLAAGAGAADVGLPVEVVAARVARRVAPAVRVDGAAPPDLVVTVHTGAAVPQRTASLLRDDLAHLVLITGEAEVTVGPLVVPGRSACQRCVDLHRADADPAWPAVAAQVAGRRRGAPSTEESALATTAAGLAVLQVLAHLDGRVPAARDATVEVGLPDGLARRRIWSAHPDCGCCWPPPGIAQQAPAPTRAASLQAAPGGGSRTAGR